MCDGNNCTLGLFCEHGWRNCRRLQRFSDRPSVEPHFHCHRHNASFKCRWGEAGESGQVQGGRIWANRRISGHSLHLFQHSPERSALRHWLLLLASGLVTVGSGLFPDSLVSYVEEDQEAQGAHAPLKGQPRQASKHGSRLSRTPYEPPRFIACGRYA